MTRKALGRGLGALIPGASEPQLADVALEGDEPFPATGSEPHDHAARTVSSAAASERVSAAGSGVRSLGIAAIRANPRQPRHDFPEDSLLELAISIQAHGIIQPILVRPVGRDFQLVACERRLRAAQQAGLTEIPAIVREVPDEQLLEVALIENLQREDLNPIDEALAYQALIDELHYTHEQLSHRLGKNRTSITNSLRLLGLPANVRDMVSRETLSAGHARALLGLASASELEAVARYVVDMGLTVRKTEALVARKLRRKTATRRPRGQDASLEAAAIGLSSEYAEITDRLRRRFATQVRIVPQGKKGKVEIEYYSESDLERILELLGALQ